MVSNSLLIENNAVPLPITSKDREIARNFASEQATKQKGEQVLYNTLAVLTVHSYLRMLGIATDLPSSDSWNVLLRTLDNVADLNILGLGKLECRPVKNSDSSCHIPMDVWDLRLGYAIVKIDDSLKKAALLGFVPQVTSEELAISNLKPVEALLDRLNDARLTKRSSMVDLGRWLDNIFATSWLTVETLLSPEQLAPALEFRNTQAIAENALELKGTNDNIQRAKLIDLGIYFGNRQVVLLVEITPEANGTIAVILQVHPSYNNVYLPKMLILKVLESSGEVFMQAQARSKDNFIQLQFSGRSGECFAVQIVLGDAELTEQFQL